MAYSTEQINAIYDRTSGYCHICHRKLAFCNYGRVGERGAWEVEHSRPRARGGSSRLCNLYAACIWCNRSKGKGSTRTARAYHGNKRAPLSHERRQEAKQRQALAGAAVLGTFGGLAFGPLGAVGGALLGAALGDSQNPDHG